jgi:hypothetical protein
MGNTGFNKGCHLALAMLPDTTNPQHPKRIAKFAKPF